MIRRLCAATLSAASLLALATTVTPAEELPIARVFAAPALNGPVPRGVQLAPDGALVTYLKPEPDDQTTFDLWERPVKGGKETRLVEGSKVEPKDTVLSEVEKSRRERERTAGRHRGDDYKWDDIGTQILIPAGGDLYLATAKTGAVKKLGETAGG